MITMFLPLTMANRGSKETHGESRQFQSWLQEIVTTASDFPPYHRGICQNLMLVSANIKLEKSDEIADSHGETLDLLVVTFPAA